MPDIFIARVQQGDMSDLEQLCAGLAGGFSQEGSDCVVCIDSPETPQNQLVKVVARPPLPLEDPEALLNGICTASDSDPAKVVVTVFQLCGGIDGRKMAASKN